MILPGDVGDVVFQSNRNPFHHRLSLLVIKHAVHLGLLSGRVGVLFEETADAGDALIAAATRFNVGLHLLLVVLDFGSLTDYDLCLALDYSEPGVEASDEGLHLVFDPSLTHVVAGFVLNEERWTMKEAG